MSFGSIVRIGKVPLSTAAKPEPCRILKWQQELFIGVRLVAIFRVNEVRMFYSTFLPGNNCPLNGLHLFFFNAWHVHHLCRLRTAGQFDDTGHQPFRHASTADNDQRAVLNKGHLPV